MERCLALRSEAPPGLLSSYGAASPLPLVRQANQFSLASFSTSLENTLTNALNNIIEMLLWRFVLWDCLHHLWPDGNSCYLSTNTSSCDCLFLFPGSLPNQCCSRWKQRAYTLQNICPCLFVCAPVGELCLLCLVYEFKLESFRGEM